MPPRRVSPPLQWYASRQFSSQVIQVLLHIEREIVALKRNQHQQQQHQDQNLYMNGVSNGHYVNGVYKNDTINILQRSYEQLVKYLESIPGVLMEQINQAMMGVYSDKYHQIDPGWRVWVLTKGVEAKEVSELVTPTYNEVFSLPSEKSPASSVHLPILSSVLSTMITPNLTILNFKQLSSLSTVSDNVFSDFNTFLSAALVKVPKLRSLTLCSPHSSNSLPQCSNAHLELVGKHCPLLEFLDVSFNKQITGDGVKHLAPNSDKNHQGCVHLKKLFIFDCGVFEKELAKVILNFPEMVHLGYKETGKVLKTLMKTDSENLRTLKLTHVDNLGSKTRRLIASAMRCKKPVTEAIYNLCPDVENVKLRVSDDDVSHLTCLTRVNTVELIYHVGNIGSPGAHTQTFLTVRGSSLSSVAIICNTMSMSMLVTIAENCPGLTQLWSRSNHLMAPYDEDLSRKPHSYLIHLKTLYFRVGEGELSVTSIPEYVLFYLLKNAAGLRELIVAIRSNMISDNYVQRLITNCQLDNLEKILFVVPGLNSLPGILKLTINTVHAIMHLCPNLRKLGNILSWDVSVEEMVEVESIVMDMNYDLEIVNRKMTMR